MPFMPQPSLLTHFWQQHLSILEPFLHGTGTLRCLLKETATYRHWSVSLWRDPDDVPHCRILSPDKTDWRLISATLCRWRRCFMPDQLWFMTHIREEEAQWHSLCLLTSHSSKSLVICLVCSLVYMCIYLGVFTCGTNLDSFRDNIEIWYWFKCLNPQNSHPLVISQFLSYSTWTSVNGSDL